MKVIFLDIDGVLVTNNHLMGLQLSGESVSDSHGHHLFDPVCVENLKRIIDTTGAKIVIASSWKMFGQTVLLNLWKERNMPGEIIAFTPTRDNRGSEIDDWLNNGMFRKLEPVDGFVIIDDSISDLLIGQADNIVKTTWADGLTSDLADKAIRVLNNSSKGK